MSKTDVSSSTKIIGAGYTKKLGEIYMLKQAILMMLFLLLAMPAFATFEIEDPAAEFLEKKPEDKAMGAKACVDFLLDGAKNPQEYQAALAWVHKAFSDGGPAEEILRDHCVDNPKQSLGAAAEALGHERL